MRPLPASSPHACNHHHTDVPLLFVRLPNPTHLLLERHCHHGDLLCAFLYGHPPRPFWYRGRGISQRCLQLWAGSALYLSRVTRCVHHPHVRNRRARVCSGRPAWPTSEFNRRIQHTVQDHCVMHSRGASDPRQPCCQMCRCVWHPKTALKMVLHSSTWQEHEGDARFLGDVTGTWKVGLPGKQQHRHQVEPVTSRISSTRSGWVVVVGLGPQVTQPASIQQSETSTRRPTQCYVATLLHYTNSTFAIDPW